MFANVVHTPGCFVNQSYRINRIYKDGLLFYVARPASRFTLPRGNYKSDFEIKLLFVINYRPKLPKREHLVTADYYQVHRLPNKHKASIFLKTGDIVIDEQFCDCPHEVIQKAILYHELGHRYYKSEKKCDRYAKERLLAEGYNPSQISAAFKATGLKSCRTNPIDKSLTKHTTKK